MKAVRIHRRGGPEVMTLEEVARPVPGSGQVLIAVAAAGVNYADIGQREGSYPNLRELPAMLGNEAAGAVAEVGPGVAGLASLPSGVDLADAMAIPIQGVTADLLLRNAGRLAPGEAVLVHVAAGGVGSLAVQLARLMGAGTVIGSTRTPAKAGLVRELGADAVASTAEAGWPEAVRAATGGRGVDVVLDPIGGEATQRGLTCLAPLGRLIVYGGLSERPTPMVAQQLIRGCQSITGYNTPTQPAADRAASARRLARMLADGELRVLRGHTFPFAEAAAAHAALAAGQAEGKVVLTVATG